MTLTTLSPKQPDSIVNRKSHYPSKNDKKGRIVFLQRKEEKMPLEARKSGSDGTFQPLRRQKQEGEKAEWKG